MATKSNDPHDVVEVAVIGAGPTGLMLANLLGLYGIRTTVLEAEAALIDYPRGVGMDDETLRTFQSAGLAAAVLEHTVPHQLLTFVDAKGRELARLAPPTSEFGWPRRNGFVQPLADRVLLEGLARFDHVKVQWSSRVVALTQGDDGVELSVESPAGDRTVRATYVVGADGGSSQTRKALGLTFSGSSAPAHWLVVDIGDDPLGRPGAWVHADPKRPYVSIGIPHGIRRFEFMLLPGEANEAAALEEFSRKLIAPIIPPDSRVEIIRQRVYTHQARIAERFRSGRVFLIGDAAHVMPVWQGQGYNSAIRDAMNLGWKLASVLRGRAGAVLLDSYESERRGHASAMIDLSRRVGTVVSVRNRLLAWTRNLFFRGIAIVPSVKRYIVTMRFKPMPTITVGALTTVGSTSRPTPVGRLFIQPDVSSRDSSRIKLDDVLGTWHAILVWNNDPARILDEDALRRLRAAGVTLLAARPAVQLGWDDGAPTDGVTVIGDIDGSLQQWFNAHEESVVLIRPDRILGGASAAHAASDMVRGFFDGIGAVNPAATAAEEFVNAGSGERA